MDLRYAAHPQDVKHYTTEELREQFLIEKLFKTGESNFVYSFYDRVVVGAVVPEQEALKLEAQKAFKTDFFKEMRTKKIGSIVR